jgi:hypothetical protein
MVAQNYTVYSCKIGQRVNVRIGRIQKIVAESFSLRFVELVPLFEIVLCNAEGLIFMRRFS